MKILNKILLLAFVCVLFTSCPNNTPDPGKVTLSFSDFVTTPNNGGKYYLIPYGTQEVTISNMPLGKKVRLVRMNLTSNTLSNIATVKLYSQDGTQVSSRSALDPEYNRLEDIETVLVPADYSDFDDRPFEIPFIDDTDFESLERVFNANRSSRIVEPNRMVAGGQSFSVGATKAFKVTKVIVVDEDEEEEVEEVEIEIHATLRAEGQHCYVWVSDGEIVDDQGNYSNTGKFGNFDSTSATTNNDNKITLNQAEDLATAFDAIYPRETALIGSSYTTNPNSNAYINPQAKISILVYDIGGDYTQNQTGGTFGMFCGGDLYNTSESNRMELLYVDAHFTDKYFPSVISTLSHEFEHMLYFIHKRLGRNQYNGSTWYTEMGAMMAEDCFAKYLEDTYKDNQDPYKNFFIVSDSPLSRFPRFNFSYYSGSLTNWNSTNDIYTSYAFSGIFGCWLLRNYGGSNLLKEIVNNNYVDGLSIQAAIRTLGSSDAFNDAFVKFALSFAQPNATLFTLNKGVIDQNYPLVVADPWNRYYRGYDSATNREMSYNGPIFIPEDYNGYLYPYGFWITGWNSEECTSVKLTLSKSGKEKNYIVITD